MLECVHVRPAHVPLCGGDIDRFQFEDVLDLGIQTPRWYHPHGGIGELAPLLDCYDPNMRFLGSGCKTAHSLELC